MSYDYEESLSEEVKCRYKAKLRLVNLDSCPYKIPTCDWIKSPIGWPELQWGDIVEYLVNGTGTFKPKHPHVLELF